MKRIAIFVAASAIVLGAGLAVAQNSGGRGAGPADGQRMEQRAERMAERFEKRLTRIKSELKLTAQQEPLFAPIEAHVRKTMTEMRGMRGQREDMRKSELPARLDMMAQRSARMSANMQELSTLVKPLWATLDETQKATVAKLFPGRGKGGHGRGPGGHHGHDRG